MSEDTYRLDQKFEAAIAYHVATEPRFWGLLGPTLDYKGFENLYAQRTIQATTAIAKEQGIGPSNIATVLQRLMRWVAQGKLTREEVLEVDEYLSNAEDANPPGYEEVVKEFAPILQRRAHKKVVQTAMDVYAKRGDMSQITRMLEGADRIGLRSREVGSELNASSMDHIEAIRNLKRLSLGIPDLDNELRGGPARTEMTVVLGGTGDGKSMFLSHGMCAAVRQGASCAYATLELGEAFIFARLIANLTGVEINDIIDGHGTDIATDRLTDFMNNNPVELGRSFVKGFTPHATTVEDLAEWLDDLEADGHKIDALFVDYGDKMAHSEKGDYTGMRQVFEGIRILGVKRDMWTFTASQATRRKDKGSGGKKILDVDDGADSQHKVRVADLVITLNASEDVDEILFNIGKNRNGKSNILVGPVPTEFECARISPIIIHNGWTTPDLSGGDDGSDVPF